MNKFIQSCMAVLAAVVLLAGCGAVDKQIEKKLAEAAEQVNAACPMQIDEVTTLSSAEVLPGKVFRYNYVVALPEGVDPSVLETVVPQMKQAVKVNGDLAVMRQAGVTFSYSYSDAEGNELYTFDITPEDYR